MPVLHEKPVKNFFFFISYFFKKLCFPCNLYRIHHYFNVETTDEFIFSGRIELDYDIELESIDSIAELLTSLSEPEVTIEELDEFEVNA